MLTPLTCAVTFFFENFFRGSNKQILLINLLCLGVDIYALCVQVAVAQVTMLVTALVHRFMREIDVLLDRHLWLSFALSKRDEKVEIARLDGFTWKNHVVIVGFNETALEIAELFREQQQDVVVIDLDWKLHEVLQGTFKDAHRGLDHDQSVRSPTNFPPPQRLLEHVLSRDLSRQPTTMFPGQSTKYHMVGTAFGAAGAAEEEEPESYLAGSSAYGPLHAHVRAHGQYVPMSEPKSAPMHMQGPIAHSMLMSNGSKVLPPSLSLLLGRTPLLVSRTLALKIASHPYTAFGSDGNEGSGKESACMGFVHALSLRWVHECLDRQREEVRLRWASCMHCHDGKTCAHPTHKYARRWLAVWATLTSRKQHLCRYTLDLGPLGLAVLNQHAASQTKVF
jgi:hypothetical protein